MEAKHLGKAGQAAAAETGPERTEPPEPITHDQAAANLQAGLDVSWVRHFRRFEDTDGATRYVDERTGETHDAIPAMHQTDGKTL